VDRFFSLEVKVIVTITNLGLTMCASIVTKDVETFHCRVDGFEPTLGGTQSSMKQEEFRWISPE
jgi:hypothetical protein